MASISKAPSAGPANFAAAAAVSILFHLALWQLLPASFSHAAAPEKNERRSLQVATAPPDEEIPAELLPAELRPPKPHFVEVNPDAPNLLPPDTLNQGAATQRAAQPDADPTETRKPLPKLDGEEAGSMKIVNAIPRELQPAATVLPGVPIGQPSPETDSAPPSPASPETPETPKTLEPPEISPPQPQPEKTEPAPAVPDAAAIPDAAAVPDAAATPVAPPPPPQAETPPLPVPSPLPPSLVDKPPAEVPLAPLVSPDAVVVSEKAVGPNGVEPSAKKAEDAQPSPLPTEGASKPNAGGPPLRGAPGETRPTPPTPVPPPPTPTPPTPATLPTPAATPPTTTPPPTPAATPPTPASPPSPPAPKPAATRAVPAGDAVPPSPLPRPQPARVGTTGVLLKTTTSTSEAGTLALDARFSEFGDYTQRFLEVVQASWWINIERTRIRESVAVVVVDFTLCKDGTLRDVIIAHHTSGEAASYACKDAIESRAPFDPWPEEMVKALGGEDRGRIVFHYR